MCLWWCVCSKFMSGPYAGLKGHVVNKFHMVWVRSQWHGYKLDDWHIGIWLPAGAIGQDMFSYSPKHQRPGLGPHSVLFSRYQRLFAWGYSQDVELNIHLSLMPVLGMYVALFFPPWVFMAWCLIKHKDEFTFTNMDKELKMSDFRRVNNSGLCVWNTVQTNHSSSEMFANLRWSCR